MRNIKDITDDYYAIHCNNQQEWDGILKFFPGCSCRNDSYGQMHVGKPSDTISHDGCGWGDLSFYLEDTSFKIYKASEFLEPQVINQYEIY